MTLKAADVFRASSETQDALIRSLYAGKVAILRGAFPSEFMRAMRAETTKWQNRRAPSFHKMLEGVPDFHRIIDREAGNKYAFKQAKHSAYFFPWNGDPLDLFPTINSRWSRIKWLMGMDPHEYESNTPKDGVVDRIQVVRYPPGDGFLETHFDPHQNQRLFISGYMSKRGVDYEGGGYYLIGTPGQRIDIEDQIEVGDMAIGYATVVHGVAPCDGECDWSKDDGRWFLGLYSVDSDEQTVRHTGTPVSVK